MAITPQMARQELARRKALNITPEMARAELARRETQKQQPGALVGGAEELGSGLSTGIQQSLLNLAPLTQVPPELKQELSQMDVRAGISPADITAPIVRKPIEAAGVPTGTIPAAIGRGIGGMIPAITATPEIAGARAIESIPAMARGLFGLGAGTAATTPGTPLERGATGALTAAIGAAIPSGAKIGKKAINALLRRNITAGEKAVSDEAKPVADYMYNGFKKEKLGQEHRQLGQAAKDDYTNQMNIGDKLYTGALKKAGNSPVVKGKVKEFKFLNELKNDVAPDTSSGAKAVKRAIGGFEEQPTFNKLHELQSKVGGKISDLYAEPYMTRDKARISDLKGIKNQLLDFLESNLPGKDGQKYATARKHWAENVIPYREDSLINQVVTKGKLSKALPGRLALEELEDGTQNAVATVLKHMDPKIQKNILANHIKGAISTTGKINPKTLLNKLNTLRSAGYGHVMDGGNFTPQIENYINKLDSSLTDLERQKRVSKLVRHGAGWIGGVVPSILLGRELMRDI